MLKVTIAKISLKKKKKKKSLGVLVNPVQIKGYSKHQNELVYPTKTQGDLRHLLAKHTQEEKKVLG